MLNYRNHQSSRRQQGFTLAEILVTTAIFAIIMIAALAVYDRSNRVFKTSTEAADLQQSTRIGFDKLVADVRQAGFDYSRGGIPQESRQAVQPDEQIEYAGPAAVVIRSNFNYQTAAAQGNGLEPAYTPVNVSGQPIFPYVTTSNDEIVAYVLRSTNASANSQSISFWVDDYRPRSVFPASITPAPAGTNPSRSERQVTVSGIDTTNNNPPYTLYRVTVNDVANSSLGTPVAENVRSLNFQYYSDAKGTIFLKNSDGTDIASGRNAGGGTFTAADTGAIGGDGQYDPNNVGTTSNFNDRQQRGLIQAIRVNLIGMNATRDLEGYTHPTETIAGIRNYRQYALSSIIVPRNLGKTGFPEPSYNPPGPPTITGMCIGHCGAPAMFWTAPSVGGPILQYRIEWDSNPNGAFNNSVVLTDASAVSTILADDGVYDVSQTRYYRLRAENDNGASIPSNVFSAVPQNKTKPEPASALTASAGAANRVDLTWTVPTANATGFQSLSCSGTGGSTDGSLIPPQETLTYRVYRGTEVNFDPTSVVVGVDRGVIVLDFNSPGQPTGAPGGTVAWSDSRLTSLFPPANCKNYFYRVRVADRCVRQANWNVSNSPGDSISDFFPPLNQDAIAGSASSRVTPNPPASLSIDRTTPNATGCPDPLNLASPNCRITLNWSRVTNDTGGSAIAVDQYRITRSLRVQALGGPFAPDVLFGPSGQQTINCSTGNCPVTPPGPYSQLTAGIASYVDFPQQVNSSGQALEYQYTVAALGCPTAQTVPSPAPNDPYSVESNAVVYPGCALNPSIVQAGAQNAGATGDTPAQAWVFNSGDTITVSPTPPTVLQSVNFEVSMWPQGTAIGLGGLDITSPYQMSWSDQIDQQIYLVRITVTNTAGCSEIHVKYVQDEQGALCAFANQSPPPATGLGVPNGNGASVLITLSQSITMRNNGTDPLQLAGRNIAITWGRPASDTLHPDLKLTALTWSTGAFSNSDNLSPAVTAPAAGTTIVTTRTVPAGMPNVAVGATYTVTLRWQYLKSDDCPGNNCPAYDATRSFVGSPASKVCLDYRIAAEPGVTKHCNVIGQAASTANPTTCD